MSFFQETYFIILFFKFKDNEIFVYQENYRIPVLIGRIGCSA
ncbi:hypothetical protein Bresa_02912|nr:hypothetical protein [Brenneria salicis ATCC 15712 = DSM 30166]